MEERLSDGSFLRLPDDLPEDQQRVRVQQAEEKLKILNAQRSQDQEPLEPGQSWYEPGLTAAKEFGVGAVKGTAGLPDIVPNVGNTVIAVSRAGNPWERAGVKPDELYQPWGGGAEAVEETVPVTPGYEGVRETGELIGGSVSGGAAAGGALGTVLGPVGTGAGALAGAGEGLRSALFSLAGEKAGEVIDTYLTEHPEDRRWETLLGTAGAFSPL